MQDELKKDVIDSMEWLVKDAKWRFDQCKDNLCVGSGGGYSPELTKAIKTLEKLKKVDSEDPWDSEPPPLRPSPYAGKPKDK